MSGNRPAVADIDVDLGRLFASLVRNWLRILVFALVVTAIAFMLASTATPLFRAETRILIESRESVFTRPSTTGSESSQPLLDEEAITSQVEVISSSDILRDVAETLDLAGREEFGAGQGSLLSRLLVLTGLRSDPSQASVEERVIGAMRERLTIFRVDRSRVIVIRFSSEDPELAAQVPNAIADAYIAVQEGAKLASNADATAWLEPEIADLRDRVREAEGRVANYRSQSDLLIGQGNTVLSTQQLAELSSELTRVRASRGVAEASAASIRDALASGASLDSIPEISSAPIVQRLRERQLEQSSQLADLSATLLGNHPRIRSLRSQLAETEAQLRAEMGKVLSRLETEAETAAARERQVLADLNGLKAASARAGEDEVELRALEREASAQRALLESYLTRYREAASRADRNYLPADARVFARATPPAQAYFPKVMPMTAAAFAGALLLVSIGTLLQELFSGRAMRPAGAAMLPVEDVAMPADAASAAPDTLPAGFDGLTVVGAARHIVEQGATRAFFVSPEGDEATAASVMVARDLADEGLRVLFLDLTYDGAPSTSMLESARYPGITNLLASEVHFSDIIRGDAYSDCHVIPVGTAAPEKAMKAADRLPIVMNALTSAYDVVVTECGATNGEGVGRLFSDDSVILLSVIEPMHEAVAEAERSLTEAGYEVIVKVTPVGVDAPTAASHRSVA